MKGFSKLAALAGMASRPRRPRLRLDLADTVVYAVGDVHGCLDLLQALERRIAEDAEQLQGRKLLLMLGDYVDRGPHSAQVLDHLLQPPPAGFERICLAGNHEMAMLDVLDGRIRLADWLHLGGLATLESYGVDAGAGGALDRFAGGEADLVRAAIPAEHVAFLSSLPVLVDAGPVLFVHAGIRPGVALDDQLDEDLLTIRAAFHDHADRLDRLVVHGHTPVGEPVHERRRINIDTGAVFSGRLTALRLWQGRGRFLSIDSQAHSQL